MLSSLVGMYICRYENFPLHFGMYNKLLCSAVVFIESRENCSNITPSRLDSIHLGNESFYHSVLEHSKAMANLKKKVRKPCQ